MSVSVASLDANTLTATVSSDANANHVLIGCHIFIPTGASLGSVNAPISLTTGTSIDCRVHVNASRTLFTRHNSGTGQNNNTGFTIPLDTWTSVLFLMGPFDGGSTGTNIGYQNGSKNTDNDATADISETFNQLKIGGDHETANNNSTFATGSIAEAFMFDNISEANADTIAAEADDLVPSAFSIAPDHYWPLLSNGNASLGGNGLTSGGSPTFDSGEHPALSGATATLAPPILVMV